MGYDDSDDDDVGRRGGGGRGRWGSGEGGEEGGGGGERGGGRGEGRGRGEGTERGETLAAVEKLEATVRYALAMRLPKGKGASNFFTAVHRRPTSEAKTLKKSDGVAALATTCASRRHPSCVSCQSSRDRRQQQENKILRK